MKKLTSFILFSLLAVKLIAQDLPINPKLLKSGWPNKWISCPNIEQRAYGVYHFRKAFDLAQRPAKFIIHVSADNRYRLFVNGVSVSSGPARGDLAHWFYETVDIAPYLQNGKNVLAALVWNMGEHAAVAQITNQTAFMLNGDTETEKIVNSDKSWKVIQNQSYTPCSTDNGSRLWTYMVIGPGDKVDATKYPHGWQENNFDDSKWVAARELRNPEPDGSGSDNIWTLIPRTIPAMEEFRQNITQIRRATGLNLSVSNLKFPLTLPANTKVSILLDQTFNTTAYPELITSGGQGATIQITYAEALFKDRKKANRNEIEGRDIMGNFDIFLPDGGQNRLFRPLWTRTFRYLQLDIETKSTSLIINDLYEMFTAYPFQQKASFESNDKSLQDIWNVGWRTARLCAGETYFDCPYYEQLQYEGDTRIQSLISLYVTGDDRLMRKAINDFYNSRVSEGLTQGRYPSNRLQVIPPFSLYWVSMVYDYWMHRKDDAFVKKNLTAIRGVLDWYENHIDKSKKMLGPMEWWNFVDWSRKNFDGGTPMGANDGNSSIVTLQYVYTLNQAARIFAYFDQFQQADQYMKLAGELANGTFSQCYDANKGLLADTPEKKHFSQHANIMGVLSGAVSSSQQKAVMNKVLEDKDLVQATFYYRFYLNQALKKAGMADSYYAQLTPWRDMLNMGLTTFAEEPEPTRSDCHAWSASPNYDFLATICGIMPDRPGFETVRIQPALGELQDVSGKMPHPKGEISVKLKRNGPNGIIGEVTLPANVKGIFVWNGQEIPLLGGRQEVKM